MSYFMLLDGPLRGQTVDELPRGYEVAETSDRIGVWTQSHRDLDELYASALSMEDAAARIDTQVLGQLGNSVTLVKTGDETDAAVRAFRDARERHVRVLNKMMSDPYRAE